MATRILLVRHGDTMASKETRFTGAMDVPLSKEGRIHASDMQVVCNALMKRRGSSRACMGLT